MEPARAPVSDGPVSTGPVSRREFAFVLLAAALLFAWPFRDALFTTERVVFGVDCATAQLPWSAVLDGPSGELPRNPAASDQAHGFYPFYRWVSESWRSGDAPLWNPLIYAGVPGLGNPQTGALDPQVGLLVGLEALFGPAAFDWGLTATAWLRLVFSALGAWLLARVLGLSRRGAGLAASAFALSGFQLLWLGFSLGHVGTLLPWILYFIERVRARPTPGAFVGVALTTTLSILAGHPETTFYVGVAAGAWALAVLREDRRAGLWATGALVLGTLLAAPMILPFLEYLEHSAAQLIREQRSLATQIDLASVGALAVVGALALRWRRGAEREAGRGAGHVQTLGVALVALGAGAVLAGRGLPSTAPLALLPDLYGLPGDGRGYRGPGSIAETASAWLPFVVFAFAGASLLAPRGPLRRRNLIGGLGLVALLLCLHTPGLLELYRRLPEVGHGAPVRFGVVSALFLGLLAGEAVERGPRASRHAAAAALGALVLLTLLAPEPRYLAPDVEFGPEASDEHVGFLHPAEARFDEGAYRVEGWISAALPAASAQVRVERAGLDGAALGGPRFSFPAELFGDRPARVRGDAPPDARFFACPTLVGGPFEEGAWRMTLELLGADGSLLGERRAAVVERRARGNAGPATLIFVGGGLGVLVAPWAGGLRGLLAIALCLLQGFGFARRVAPAVPRAEFFPPTATEALIARELDGGRYLGDDGVMPPSTGMVRGLRAADGYDGMDITAFNTYRMLAVLPGTHALLGWTPRGVDLDGNAFRLLGVTVLATREPLDHPDWELFAGPREAPEPAQMLEPAEVFLHRARTPLPTAFVAGALATADELAADLRGWDPLEVATWEGEGEIAHPRTEWSCTEVGRGNNEVRLEVELDGDGLLVLTEQNFPGWTAEVDGAPAELATANGIFRGVLLPAGRHEVVFRYWPRSLTLGIVLAAIAALGLAAPAVRNRVHRRRLRT